MSINLSPAAHAPHWSAGYVGRAWGIDYTCWHLLVDVQARVFGRAVPPLVVDANMGEGQVLNMLRAAAWCRLPASEAPVDGDVLAMRGPAGVHVGVVVVMDAATSVLHNVGGMDDGHARGGVALDAWAGLPALGYSRLELWRPL